MTGLDSIGRVSVKSCPECRTESPLATRRCKCGRAFLGRPVSATRDLVSLGIPMDARFVCERTPNGSYVLRWPEHSSSFPLTAREAAIVKEAMDA